MSHPERTTPAIYATPAGYAEMTAARIQEVVAVPERFAELNDALGPFARTSWAACRFVVVGQRTRSRDGRSHTYDEIDAASLHVLSPDTPNAPQDITEKPGMASTIRRIVESVQDGDGLPEMSNFLALEATHDARAKSKYDLRVIRSRGFFGAAAGVASGITTLLEGNSTLAVAVSLPAVIASAGYASLEINRQHKRTGAEIVPYYRAARQVTGLFSYVMMPDAPDTEAR